MHVPAEPTKKLSTAVGKDWIYLALMSHLVTDDCGGLCCRYLPEREYLRDMHHPSKQISLTALNILLNVVFSRVKANAGQATFVNQDIWGPGSS